MELRESDYAGLRKEAIEQGKVCHGEYNQHNVLMLKPGTAVTNFEHWGFDVQISDLYRFMRKILEKYSWDVRIGMEMLRTIIMYTKKHWFPEKIQRNCRILSDRKKTGNILSGNALEAIRFK